MKTFGELYNDYLSSLRVQKSVIARYRLLLAGAAGNSDMEEVRRLNSILNVLYQEKTELEESAAQIKSYLSALHKSKQNIGKNIDF